MANTYFTATIIGNSLLYPIKVKGLEKFADRTTAEKAARAWFDRAIVDGQVCPVHVVIPARPTGAYRVPHLPIKTVNTVIPTFEGLAFNVTVEGEWHHPAWVTIADETFTVTADVQVKIEARKLNLITEQDLD